jgi:hypothetical protein
MIFDKALSFKFKILIIMKTKNLLVLTISLFSMSFAFSQEQYNRSFYFDPISIFAGKMNVGYEQINFNNNSSILVSASGYYNTSIEYMGTGAEFMYRKFLIDLNSSKGKNKIQWKPYFGPYVSYKFHQIEGVSINSAGGGVLFGARTTGSRIVLDVFLGGGFKYSDNTAGEYYSDLWYFSPDYSGFLPKAGVKIGLNF